MEIYLYIEENKAFQRYTMPFWAPDLDTLTAHITTYMNSRFNIDEVTCMLNGAQIHRGDSTISIMCFDTIDEYHRFMGILQY